MNLIVKIIIRSCCVLSLISVPLIANGETYAPLYKFTEKDFNSKFGQMGMSIKDAEMMGMWPPVQAKNVPDKGAITAPAYPGAVIVAIHEPFIRDDQGKLMGFSTLELLSSDSYEKVISYYKEKLPAWNEKKFQSSYYLAESGEVENGARNMKVPHIGFMNLEGGILGKENLTFLGLDDLKRVVIR